MKIDSNELRKIQKLVGDITESNLKYVDCYVSDELGIFIPSVGFCEYAITPQHIHPAYSFILLFSKDQNILIPEIEIPDKHYLMAAISPDIPHEENIGDSFTRYIAIMISKNYFERQYELCCSRPLEQYVWKQFTIEHEIMLYLKKLMTEYENRTSGYEYLLEGLVTVITHQIIRNLLDIYTPTDHNSERFEIEKILEYMNTNFGEKLSISKLSRVASMSQSHFTRFFKKETGFAPMEYLIKLRLEKAKKLLMSGAKSVTEISLICGFNSTSHFSSSFTKFYKISPSEYQRLG